MLIHEDHDRLNPQLAVTLKFLCYGFILFYLKKKKKKKRKMKRKHIYYFSNVCSREKKCRESNTTAELCVYKRSSFLAFQKALFREIEREKKPF